MLKRITANGRTTGIFISDQPIGRCASVVITNIDGGSRGARVSEGTTALTGAGIGVSITGALSGKPCRVVLGGVVSGVVLAGILSGQRVGAGDPLCAANNTSGPGATSGAGKLAFAYLIPQVLLVSGLHISGNVTGTAYNPRKVIALALMSGGIGSAIPVMVVGG
jgi:hypothetical protein